MNIRETILDALFVEMQVLTGSDGIYASAGIKHLSRYEINLTNLPANIPTPLVSMVDTGDETILVRSATKLRKQCPIIFRCALQGKDSTQLQAQMNEVAASVMLWISGKPNGGVNCLRLQLTEVNGFRYNPKENYADALIAANLIYWQSKDVL